MFPFASSLVDGCAFLFFDDDDDDGCVFLSFDDDASDRCIFLAFDDDDDDGGALEDDASDRCVFLSFDDDDALNVDVFSCAFARELFSFPDVAVFCFMIGIYTMCNAVEQ